MGRLNINTHIESSIYIRAERTDLFTIIAAHHWLLFRQRIFPYLFAMQFLIGSLWESLISSTTHNWVSVLGITVLCFIERLRFVRHYLLIYILRQFCRIS